MSSESEGCVVIYVRSENGCVVVIVDYFQKWRLGSDLCDFENECCCGMMRDSQNECCGFGEMIGESLCWFMVLQFLWWRKIRVYVWLCGCWKLG